MVLKTIFKISVSFKNAPFIARKRLPLLHRRFVNAKELLSLDTASLFLKVRLRRRRTWSLRANYESTRFEYWRLCRRGLYLNQARWRRRDSPGWEWCAANKRIWWSATIVKQVWLFLEHIFCRNRRHCTVVEPFFSLVILKNDVRKRLTSTTTRVASCSTRSSGPSWRSCPSGPEWRRARTRVALWGWSSSDWSSTFPGI